MPFDLATQNPTIFPTPVSAPSDSDSPLASGQLRTVLQQLKDRSDFLRERGFKSSNRRTGLLNSLTTSGVYVDIVGSSTVVMASAGDILRVSLYVVLSPDAASGCAAQVYYYNPDATTTVIGESGVGVEAGTDPIPATIVVEREATQTGLHNFYVRQRSYVGGTSTGVEVRSLIVDVMKVMY